MGKSSGPNRTMAGMPSSTLPSTTKQTMEISMKPNQPPGIAAMLAASWRLKPDWVSPQAMPVAVPMISRMAPERAAVSSSIGMTRRQSNWRWMSRPTMTA